MSPRSIWNRPLLLAILLAARAARGQDLSPRAYFITPTSSNAVTLSSSFSTGQVVFDPTLPVDEAEGKIDASVLSYYHSYGLLGRSANITVSLPYGTGTLSGLLAGVPTSVYRSGLADLRVRAAVNLRGGPAMPVQEYVKWRESTVIGASLTVVAPTGQNDPAKVINVGANRWSFKPEVGFSKRWRRWVVDSYAGVWFFTANDKFYPGYSVRTQAPVSAFEGHLGYYLRPRLWASLDGNFWVGGRTTTAGIQGQDQARNSRAGVTFSIPIGQRQSLKFSYNRGAYVRIGGDFHAVSVAWQYSWFGKPK